MIDRVHFENFKSLQDVTLQLGRLTALVGPNGCGKSSVLQGTHLLSRTGARAPTDRDLNQPFGRLASIYDGPRAPGRLIYRRRAGDMTLAMRRVDGDELQVTFHVTQPDGSDPIPSGVTVGVAGMAAPLQCQISPVTRSHVAWDQIHAVLDSDRVRRFGPAAYLRLDATEMVRTTVQEVEVPQMDFDGGGLSSVLAWMKGAAEDELAEITRDLRAIVPGVKRIKTFRERVTNRHMEMISVDGQPVWRPVDKSQLGDRFAIEFDDGTEVPADLLSEGTVLALGLLTKLRERTRSRLILLDSIARGLHLGAQVKLVQILRELMRLDPELQIVCTTHSPYLLDLFEPAEVRVLALDPERRTHARPLIEHPDFARWKFGTQTGELWAALGEAWVLAGAAG
jgi:energy-coupling factor transporter ATP-binding protein EcfA2